MDNRQELARLKQRWHLIQELEQLAHEALLSGRVSQDGYAQMVLKVKQLRQTIKQELFLLGHGQPQQR